MGKPTDKASLIYKVVCGAASCAEKKELESWVSQNTQNREEFEDLKLLFENAKRAWVEIRGNGEGRFNSIRTVVHKRHRAKKRMRTALVAAAILLTGFVGWFLIRAWVP